MYPYTSQLWEHARFWIENGRGILTWHKVQLDSTLWAPVDPDVSDLTLSEGEVLVEAVNEYELDEDAEPIN